MISISEIDQHLVETEPLYALAATPAPPIAATPAPAPAPAATPTTEPLGTLYALAATPAPAPAPAAMTPAVGAIDEHVAEAAVVVTPPPIAAPSSARGSPEAAARRLSASLAECDEGSDLEGELLTPTLTPHP
jgi:hypothetical protein